MVVEIKHDPLLQCRFIVIVGGPGSYRMGFQQVEGLYERIETFKYREGGRPAPLNLPDGMLASDVTFSQGVVGEGAAPDLMRWYLESKKAVEEGRATLDRRTVTIRPINEDGTPSRRAYRLEDAWPNEYRCGGFNAMRSGVLIHRLVLSVERLAME